MTNACQELLFLLPLQLLFTILIIVDFKKKIYSWDDDGDYPTETEGGNSAKWSIILVC